MIFAGDVVTIQGRAHTWTAEVLRTAALNLLPGELRPPGTPPAGHLRVRQLARGNQQVTRAPARTIRADRVLKVTPGREFAQARAETRETLAREMAARLSRWARTARAMNTDGVEAILSDEQWREMALSDPELSGLLLGTRGGNMEVPRSRRSQRLAHLMREAEESQKIRPAHSWVLHKAVIVVNYLILEDETAQTKGDAAAEAELARLIAAGMERRGRDYLSLTSLPIPGELDRKLARW